MKLVVFRDIEKVHKKHPDCGITAISAVNIPEDTYKMDIWFNVRGSTQSRVTYCGFCNKGNFWILKKGVNVLAYIVLLFNLATVNVHRLIPHE